MIRYHVRSRDLVGVYTEIRAERLVLNPYFQRNLVWREIHKQDFIKTLLKGYPIPQIFVAKGQLDVESMKSTECVVDGQQRLNAIVGFIDGAFTVDGKHYSDLGQAEKTEFLKYEIPVIDLEMQEDDPRLKDVFQMLNRNANSLTAIEKLASLYAPSEFMLFANHLSGDLIYPEDNEDGEDKYRVDPAVDPEFFEWAKDNEVVSFTKLMTESGAFKGIEIARKVHLMHILNIASTVLVGFFNRNDKSRELLDTYKEELPGKAELLAQLDQAAAIVNELAFEPGSYWLSKTNLFTILVALARRIRAGGDIQVDVLRQGLTALERNLPNDYQQSARQSVNNTRERETRNRYIEAILG